MHAAHNKTTIAKLYRKGKVSFQEPKNLTFVLGIYWVAIRSNACLDGKVYMNSLSALYALFIMDSLSCKMGFAVTHSELGAEAEAYSTNWT